MKLWRKIKSYLVGDIIIEIGNLQEIPTHELVEYLDKPVQWQLGNEIIRELIKRLLKDKQ